MKSILGTCATINDVTKADHKLSWLFMSLAIEAFSDNARSFCEWVESKEHDPLRARQLLLSLMAGIPYLIVSESDVNQEQDYPYRTHEEWKLTHAGLADFPFQYYRQVFAPLKVDDDASVVGDVHDDLADIYDELWHGLQALDRRNGVYAVEHWRNSYIQHWGQHASSALMAIDEHYRSR